MDDKTLEGCRGEVQRACELTEAGRFGEAEECLAALLARHPNYCPALFNYGKVLVCQDRDEEALSRFTRVLKLEGDALDAFIETGLIHYRAGRLSEAETVFHDALCVDDNDARVLNNLGVLAFVQSRFPEAESFFARALEIDPDNEDYAVNLHDTREELQKTEVFSGQ